MKKITFIFLFSILLFSAAYAITPTVTQTITPTVISTPRPSPTITVTPFLNQAEIIVWREKLNPIKALTNIKAFTNVIGKTQMTDAEVIEYVKFKSPVSEIISVKTIAAKPTATKTLTAVKTK